MKFFVGFFLPSLSAVLHSMPRRACFFPTFANCLYRSWIFLYIYALKKRHFSYCPEDEMHFRTLTTYHISSKSVSVRLRAHFKFNNFTGPLRLLCTLTCVTWGAINLSDGTPCSLKLFIHRAQESDEGGEKTRPDKFWSPWKCGGTTKYTISPL